MNDDEAKALGLRAAAAKEWDWRPGMLEGKSDIRAEDTGYGHGPGLPSYGRDGEVDYDYLGHGDWPDLRDAATMGAAIAQWQARPGHIYRTPCPVLSTVAAYGLTSRQAIEALVGALEGKQ